MEQEFYTLEQFERGENQKKVILNDKVEILKVWLKPDCWYFSVTSGSVHSSSEWDIVPVLRKVIYVDESRIPVKIRRTIDLGKRISISLSERDLVKLSKEFEIEIHQGEVPY